VKTEKAGAEPETQQCAEQNENRPENGASQRKGNDWRQLGILLPGTSFFGNGTLGITKGLLSVLLFFYRDSREKKPVRA